MCDWLEIEMPPSINVARSTRVTKFYPPKKWKYPESGAYETGNPLAPAVVVLPTPNSDLIQVALETGVAIVGFVRTANVGVEKVIANIVANPNIRWVIVFGRESEGHMPGQTLVSVRQNGINKQGKVIGSKGLTPYLLNLPKKAIDRFRSQVQVIDAIGCDHADILRKLIKGTFQEKENPVSVYDNRKSQGYALYDPGRYWEEPIRVSILDKLKSYGFYEIVSHYTTAIHAKDIASAYRLLLDAIASAGIEYKDERNSYVKELLNVQVNLGNPLENFIPHDPPFLPEGMKLTDSEMVAYLETYAKTYFLPYPAEVNFQRRLDGSWHFKLVRKKTAYTYGQRLVSHWQIPQVTRYERISGEPTRRVKINQLEVAVSALRDSIARGNPTRRVVMSLIDPAKDLRMVPEREEIPCFTQYFAYPRKDGEKWKIHGVFIMRSHDAYKAFIPNAFAAGKILEYLSRKVDASSGTLTIFLGSAHIYLSDVTSEERQPAIK
jgi:tetrahydromethanopterin S-methyltransferase subunit A